MQCYNVDVTSRSLLAERYTDAGTKPGEAAEACAKDRKQRYGERVISFAFESFGRLASSADNALRHLAERTGFCVSGGLVDVCYRDDV